MERNRSLVLSTPASCSSTNVVYIETVNEHDLPFAASLRSPLLDEERIKPDHWLGSVLLVTFSALTLIVG